MVLLVQQLILRHNWLEKFMMIFMLKKKQTVNERLCSIRSVFDKNNLISGIHSFMSVENEKYRFVLPPLALLNKDKEKKMMEELKDLDFYPEKDIAA